MPFRFLRIFLHKIRLLDDILISSESRDYPRTEKEP
jgi:hypothetical protein